MSLLELLIAMLLSSVVAFTALTALHQNVRVGREISLHEKEENDFDALRRNLALELQRAQTLNLTPGFEIFARSAVGGARLPQLPPLPLSDAITLIEPNTDFILRRLNASSFCEEKLRTAAEHERPQFSQANFYLALGLEGYKIIRASLAASGGCSEGGYSLRSAADVELFGDEVSAVQPVVLIALDDIVTLYLDRNSDLRRYSHAAGQSQRIAGPFDSIAINARRDLPLILLKADKISALTGETISRRYFFPLRNETQSPLDVIL